MFCLASIVHQLLPVVSRMNAHMTTADMKAHHELCLSYHAATCRTAWLACGASILPMTTRTRLWATLVATASGSSRTPTMDDATFGVIIERIRTQGYETSRLVRTLQPTVPAQSARE